LFLAVDDDVRPKITNELVCRQCSPGGSAHSALSQLWSSWNLRVLRGTLFAGLAFIIITPCLLAPLFVGHVKRMGLTFSKFVDYDRTPCFCLHVFEFEYGGADVPFLNSIVSEPPPFNRRSLQGSMGKMCK
jgi:hypothetical protein